MLYRRKPQYVSAFCWTGNPDQAESPQWVKDAMREGDIYFTESKDYFIQLNIRTSQGVLVATPGDYLTRDNRGNFYSYKPKVFESLYELTS